MAWVVFSQMPNDSNGFPARPGQVASDGTYLWLDVLPGVGDDHSFYQYDPGTDTYSADLTEPHNNQSWPSQGMVYVPDSPFSSDAIYQICYSNDNSGFFTDAFNPVDVSTGTWTTGLTPIPEAELYEWAGGYFAGSGAQGNLIICGGYDAVDQTAHTWTYDIALDTWTQVADMPIPLAEVSGAWVGTNFYVFGGWDGSSYVPTGFVYDSTNDSWSTLTGIPFTGDSAGSPVVVPLANGSVVISGGYGDNPSVDTWQYDPNSDTWTALDPLPWAPAYYSQGGVVGDTVYVWDLNGDGNQASLLVGPPPVATSVDAEAATGTGMVYVPSIERPGTCRWLFYDPATATTYNFAINPNAGGSPQRKKSISTRRTSAVGGKVLMFEGSDEVPTIDWSGTLLRSEDIAVYEEWYDKNHQVRVTDDLGRSFYIWIQDFSIKREPSKQHPFRVTYTLKALTLDWPTGEIPEPGRISKSSSDSAVAGDNNGGWEDLPGSPTASVKEAVYDGTYIYMPDSSGVFWRYDPATDTWDVMAAPDIDVRFDYFGIAYDSVTNAIYIVGDSNATYIYDVALDSWSFGTAAPDYLDYMSAAQVGRLIYITAGYGGTNQELYAYNIDTDSWTQLADMPGTLAETGMVAVNDGSDDFLYLFGGWDDDSNDYVPAGYKYDVANDSWSTLTVLFNNETAGMPAVVTSGDFIYLINGWGDDDTAATWQYNWVTDEWTAGLDNTYTRYATAIIDSSDTIYTFSRNFSATASKSTTAIEVM